MQLDGYDFDHTYSLIKLWGFIFGLGLRRLGQCVKTLKPQLMSFVYLVGLNSKGLLLLFPPFDGWVHIYFSNLQRSIFMASNAKQKLILFSIIL